MEHVTKNYNDLPLGHPQKSYNTLVMAAQRQTNLRQDEMDRAIAESLSGKAAPAQAGSGQLGHGKYWLKGGCAKGESCMYEHEPSKKGSKCGGGNEKGRPSAKAAPVTERLNNKQGAKNNQKPRERSKDGRSSNKGDKRNPDEPKRANPCYEFANGKCTRGANCFLSVDSLAKVSLTKCEVGLQVLSPGTRTSRVSRASLIAHLLLVPPT